MKAIAGFRRTSANRHMRVLGAAALGSFFLSTAWGGAPAKRAPLTVSFLDAGHADATVISTPGGRHILIDAAGGRKTAGGKTAVLSFLESRGITKLDSIVMSHADSDHIGGLPAVLKSPLAIGELLDPGYPHTTGLYQDVLESVKKRPEIKYINPRPGQSLDWGRELTVRVMNACSGGASINDCSIVIRMTYGNVSFLFTGDAGRKAENRMADRSGSGLRAQVLKVGHHGSKSSTSARFLSLVRPEVAVISARGADPEGPNAEVTKRLRSAGAKVYQTGRYGTVTVETDGAGWKVKTERGGGAESEENNLKSQVPGPEEKGKARSGIPETGGAATPAVRAGTEAVILNPKSQIPNPKR